MRGFWTLVRFVPFRTAQPFAFLPFHTLRDATIVAPGRRRRRRRRRRMRRARRAIRVPAVPRVWQPPQKEAIALHHPHQHVPEALFVLAWVAAVEAGGHLCHPLRRRWVAAGRAEAPGRRAIGVDASWGGVPAGEPASHLRAAVRPTRRSQRQRIPARAPEAVPAAVPHASGLPVADAVHVPEESVPHVVATRPAGPLLAVRARAVKSAAVIRDVSPGVAHNRVRQRALLVNSCAGCRGEYARGRRTEEESSQHAVAECG